MDSARVSRRFSRLLAGISLLLASMAGGTACTEKSAPAADKVILISVDTLRPDFLGCYDSSIHTTPSIDSLADRGVVFERAYCNFPKTTPSHASMLSGLYTWSHGVRNNSQRISDQVTLLPEILKAQGWSTGGFVSLTTVKAIYGLDQGFDIYDDKLTIRGPRQTGGHERRCMETLEPALEWLRGHRDEKVFLFLHFADPHGPYRPPRQYLEGLPPPNRENVLPLGESNYSEDAIPAYQVIQGHDEIDFYVQRYRAEIRYVDDCIAHLLDELERLEVYDRSLILFTSDHGEAMGEHHRWFQHGSSLYYVQTRVPLVIVYPGIHPARVSGIVESVDLAPTILEYLGLEVPDEMEGKSFLGSLRDPGRPTKTTWYGDLYHSRGMEREGKKLISEMWSQQRLLFDVDADPEERVDRATEYPEVTELMDQELKRFIESRRGLEAEPPRYVSPEQELEMEKNLRSLGYVE